MAPPVFKTGLAGIAFAGGFDSLPPPPKPPLFGTRQSIGSIGQRQADPADASDFVVRATMNT